MKKLVKIGRLGPPTNLRHHAGSHEDRRPVVDQEQLKKQIVEGENVFTKERPTADRD